LTQNQ